jgi:hypothetical protein
MKILIDSGSSHSLISSKLASLLQGASALAEPIPVKVANGEVLISDSHFIQTSWCMSGYEFMSDLKVLPLSCYDMIVGLDWLEMFSPMKVHWKHKWMSIPYKDSVVLLHGVVGDLPEGTIVQLCSVQVAVGDSIAVHIPAEVQQLIEDYAVLFEVPSELPPEQACDHTIPLVDGASPVKVCPYRYAPFLKDEIEKQVKEMLLNGVIQPSSSPFSSSVLLVKKKDNT